MNACEVLTQFSVSSSLSLLPVIPFLWFSPGAFVVPCGSSTLNFVYTLNKFCFTETRWHLPWLRQTRSAATVVVSELLAKRVGGDAAPVWEECPSEIVGM